MTERLPAYSIVRTGGLLFRYQLIRTSDAGYQPWVPVSYHLTRWDANRRAKRLSRKDKT